MDRQIPIITKVEFFETSYEPMRANVSARNFSSLTYRKSGRVLVKSSEAEFVTNEGTLTFVPRGCDYFTEIYEGGEMIILHYQTTEQSGDFFNEPTLISPQIKDVFLNLFMRALEHSDAGGDYACMADAYRLFAELEKELLRGKNYAPPRLALVKRYMDERICDPELRISELAALHKTSETYFRKEFKRYYLQSPIEYIKKRRIEIACRLLQTELYSITDVASRSGFDSVSYFSSEFKKYMDCSPKEYKYM